MRSILKIRGVGDGDEIVELQVKQKEVGEERKRILKVEFRSNMASNRTRLVKTKIYIC